MYVKFKSFEGRVFYVHHTKLIETLRVAFPKKFPKGESVSEQLVKHYAKQLTQEEVNSLELFEAKPTEWIFCKKTGKISNVYQGNTPAVRSELEKRGFQWCFSSLDDGRKFLAKLEEERTTKNNQSEEEDYVAPRSFLVKPEDASVQSTPDIDDPSSSFSGWHNFTAEQNKLINLDNTIDTGESNVSIGRTTVHLENSYISQNSSHIYENDQHIMNNENAQLVLPGQRLRHEEPPQYFTGENEYKVRTFFDDYEHYMRNETNQSKKESLRTFLRGKAKEFWGIEKDEFAALETYDQYKQKLLAAYDSEEKDWGGFIDRVQKESEDPLDYVLAKRSMNLTHNINMPEPDLCNLIVKGLLNNYKLAVWMLDNSSFTKLKQNLRKAKELITKPGAIKNGSISEVRQEENVIAAIQSQGNQNVFLSKLENRVNRLEGEVTTLSSKVEAGCEMSLNINRKMEDLQNSMRDINNGLQRLFQNSGVGGQFQAQNSYFPQQVGGFQSRNTLRCNHCGRPGHEQQTCWLLYPHLRPNRRGGQITEDPNQKN